MTYNPHVFIKNYHERLNDFNNILGPGLKATEIQNVWKECIEMSIEPLGWKAIWKITRDTCNRINTHFPCTVVVYVEEVNFLDLSCSVCIIEVENDTVGLPEKINSIPLVELYPTVEQDMSSALAIQETAIVIDSLRFFYHNLWMPWDLEFEDEELNWVSSHLESRLKLHFAMAERKVPTEVRYAVRTLVMRGFSIMRQIEDQQDDIVEEGEGSSSPVKYLYLTELHYTLSIVRNKYSIYENPALLGAVVERTKIKNNPNADVTLVMSSTTSEQLLKLSNVLSNQEKKLVKTLSSLQEALSKTEEGGLVWLTQGNHPVYDLGNFECGGIIKGIEPGVVFTDNIKGSYGLDIQAGSLTLADLSLHLVAYSDLIKVRSGAECCLNSVNLQGSRVISGVDLFPSATLTAVNCHFVDCNTGVFCESQASLTLRNCTFTNNNIAIVVQEGCSFTMENCTINGSKQFGIHLIIARPIPIIRGKTSFDVLNSVPKMKENGTVGAGNTSDVHTVEILGTGIENGFN